MVEAVIICSGAAAIMLCAVIHNDVCMPPDPFEFNFTALGGSIPAKTGRIDGCVKARQSNQANKHQRPSSYG